MVGGQDAQPLLPTKNSIFVERASSPFWRMVGGQDAQPLLPTKKAIALALPKSYEFNIANLLERRQISCGSVVNCQKNRKIDLDKLKFIG
jgi:hypothetical protein